MVNVGIFWIVVYSVIVRLIKVLRFILFILDLFIVDIFFDFLDKIMVFLK